MPSLRNNIPILKNASTQLLNGVKTGVEKTAEAAFESVKGYMKHEKSVYGALFSKDESRILTWSADGTARLWDIGTDYDFPNEHLPLLLEVATGTIMDDYGNISVLSKEDWETKKMEYITIAENHLTDCKYKKYNLYLKQKQFWE